MKKVLSVSAKLRQRLRPKLPRLPQGQVAWRSCSAVSRLSFLRMMRILVLCRNFVSGRLWRRSMRMFSSRRRFLQRPFRWRRMSISWWLWSLWRSSGWLRSSRRSLRRLTAASTKSSARISPPILTLMLLLRVDAVLQVASASAPPELALAAVLKCPRSESSAPRCEENSAHWIELIAYKGCCVVSRLAPALLRTLQIVWTYVSMGEDAQLVSRDDPTDSTV